MEITEENMTQREVLEKMTELEYSLHHQRNLNAEMRLWLDIADDDIAQLRSENAALKKKVKDQAMTISVAQQVKTEPCRTLLANDLDVKRITDNNIKRLQEEESTKIKEQNKKLSAELKSLQLERDLDKISLNASKVAAQAFEQYMEEACSGLQHMDEVIHQKILKLKHLEETVEEYYNMMKVETNDQELLKHESFTIDLQKKWCAGILETSLHRAVLFVFCIFIFTVLAFVALVATARNYDFFSLNTLWNIAHLMFQRYCNVHYGALPPV
ncbi:uveal autoantigen with coiled-coil domains and ankyrin repeats protein-like isoform X6 [Channa argus]|uniref:uveal autoantigen with coiled-coil domains and ankyrin repeats protein-like isoform X6 n=1 Tax=Channa argus TaxID=215402 RepID=UPI00352146B2